MVLLFYLRLYFSFLCVYYVAGSGVEGRFRGWGQRGRIAWELNSGPLKDREETLNTQPPLWPHKRHSNVFPSSQRTETEVQHSVICGLCSREEVRSWT